MAQAGEDDLGLGLELPNLSTRHGALAPAGFDVLDRYHFDVAATSDVRLRLRYPSGRQFTMLLVTDDGRRVASGDTEIQRLLQPGRYVLAVGGVPGSASGSYAVALVIRQLTATTVAVSSGIVARGASVTLTAATAPAPDGGVVTVQIDRFDPLGGWVFSRVVKLRAPGGAVTWAPPALGRRRMRASYDGDLHFAHSTSAYVYVVAK